MSVETRAANAIGFLVDPETIICPSCWSKKGDSKWIYGCIRSDDKGWADNCEDCGDAIESDDMK